MKIVRIDKGNGNEEVLTEPLWITLEAIGNRFRIAGHLGVTVYQTLKALEKGEVVQTDFSYYRKQVEKA